MTDTAARLTAALADRYTIERGLGAEPVAMRASTRSVRAVSMR